MVGHSVWSIAVPIALVELLFPARARTPWLGRVGLVLTAAGYVAGCVVIGRFVYGSERFLASPSQLAGAAAVALGLVALAFACRPVTPPVGNGWVPRPLHLGLGVFVALGVYQVRPESWAGLVFGIAWLALLAGLLLWFARQRSWGPRAPSWRWSQRRSGRTHGSGSYSPRWWSPATQSAGPATSCSPPLRSHSSLLRAAASGRSPSSHGHKREIEFVASVDGSQTTQGR